MPPVVQTSMPPSSSLPSVFDSPSRSHARTLLQAPMPMQVATSAGATRPISAAAAANSTSPTHSVPVSPSRVLHAYGKSHAFTFGSPSTATRHLGGRSSLGGENSVNSTMRGNNSGGADEDDSEVPPGLLRLTSLPSHSSAGSTASIPPSVFSSPEAARRVPDAATASSLDAEAELPAFPRAFLVEAPAAVTVATGAPSNTRSHARVPSSGSIASSVSMGSPIGSPFSPSPLEPLSPEYQPTTASIGAPAALTLGTSVHPNPHAQFRGHQTALHTATAAMVAQQSQRAASKTTPKPSNRTRGMKAPPAALQLLPTTKVGSHTRSRSDHQQEAFIAPAAGHRHHAHTRSASTVISMPMTISTTPFSVSPFAAHAAASASPGYSPLLHSGHAVHLRSNPNLLHAASLPSSPMPRNTNSLLPMIASAAATSHSPRTSIDSSPSPSFNRVQSMPRQQLAVPLVLSTPSPTSKLSKQAATAAMLSTPPQTNAQHLSSLPLDLSGRHRLGSLQTVLTNAHEDIAHTGLSPPREVPAPFSESTATLSTSGKISRRASEATASAVPAAHGVTPLVTSGLESPPVVSLIAPVTPTDPTVDSSSDLLDALTPSTRVDPSSAAHCVLSSLPLYVSTRKRRSYAQHITYCASGGLIKDNTIGAAAAPTRRRGSSDTIDPLAHVEEQSLIDTSRGWSFAPQRHTQIFKSHHQKKSHQSLFGLCAGFSAATSEDDVQHENAQEEDRFDAGIFFAQFFQRFYLAFVDAHLPNIAAATAAAEAPGSNVPPLDILAELKRATLKCVGAMESEARRVAPAGTRLEGSGCSFVVLLISGGRLYKYTSRFVVGGDNDTFDTEVMSRARFHAMICSNDQPVQFDSEELAERPIDDRHDQFVILSSVAIAPDADDATTSTTAAPLFPSLASACEFVRSQRTPQEAVARLTDARRSAALKPEQPLQSPRQQIDNTLIFTIVYL